MTGLDRIDTSKPLVYAVNHASALDIPVLYVYLPFQFRIAFKKELLAYPIVGWHLRRSGQICVDQQNPATSIGSIRSALKGLKSGMPLVIFPEGGRTPDGEVKPFLPGAFFLAIKAQVDIVPVALVGTYELLPMNTYHIKSRPLEMRVGGPISTSGYTLRNMEELSDRVHEAVQGLVCRNQLDRRLVCQFPVSVSRFTGLADTVQSRISSSFSAMAYFRSSIPLPVTAEMGNNSRFFFLQ